MFMNGKTIFCADSMDSIMVNTDEYEYDDDNNVEGHELLLARTNLLR